MEKNTRTLVTLVTLVVGMVALSFAAVPLYRIFCQVTGFGGTTGVAEVAPMRVGSKTYTIYFDASTSPELPWDFGPSQRSIEVKPGVNFLVSYEATNESNQPTIGTATFNVTPLKAGKYFKKIGCFCFQENPLAAGESNVLPVNFFIDPAIEDDVNLADVEEITLSYTFFPLRE